jgi:hypothetical protein
MSFGVLNSCKSIKLLLHIKEILTICPSKIILEQSKRNHASSRMLLDSSKIILERSKMTLKSFRNSSPIWKYRAMHLYSNEQVGKWSNVVTTTVSS